MDIMAIVNMMQPNTISCLALNATDFPNNGVGIPFMGVFVQLYSGATLPTEEAVTAYESTYNAAIAAAQTASVALSSLPDLPTQVANLTAALLAANVIPANALPEAQITAVNNKLTAIGATPISTILTAQPTLKVTSPL